ncbi:hypothetical protein Tco_0045559 [Tanacetum coccineum]
MNQKPDALKKSYDPYARSLTEVQHETRFFINHFPALASFIRAISCRFCEAGDVNKAEKNRSKETTTAMKQLDRSAEAIEAINSFCHLCSHEPQESLTNIMLQLYKPDKNKQCDQAICLMYMKRISRETYGSYAKSYECAIMGMHGLESSKNHVTSFSLFLSRKVRDKESLNGGYFRKLQFGQPLENTDREVKSPAESGAKNKFRYTIYLNSFSDLTNLDLIIMTSRLHCSTARIQGILYKKAVDTHVWKLNIGTYDETIMKFLNHMMLVYELLLESLATYRLLDWMFGNIYKEKDDSENQVFSAWNQHLD